MTYYRKIEYIRCGECGFRHEDELLELGAGDYCPRCGTQLTEYNELTYQSFVPAGDRDRDRGPDRAREFNWWEAGVRAVSLAIPVGAGYIVLKTVYSMADATVTINGETTQLFDPGLADAVFVVILIAAVIAWGLPYLPGMAGRGRRV